MPILNHPIWKDYGMYRDVIAQTLPENQNSKKENVWVVLTLILCIEGSKSYIIIITVCHRFSDTSTAQPGMLAPPVLLVDLTTFTIILSKVIKVPTREPGSYIWLLGVYYYGPCAS